MRGRHLPSCSFTDKPALPAQCQAQALVRSCDGRCWQTVDDLRGEVAYRKDTGKRLIIDFLGNLPTELTQLAPTSPTDT